MTETIEKPDPGYRYDFARNELDRMSDCLEAHGFAIIKEVLSRIGEDRTDKGDADLSSR